MSSSAVIKVIIFLLVGVIFAVAIIAYSNARKEHGGRFVDDDDFTGRSDKSHRVIEKSYDVNTDGKLVITTDDGSVSVDTWDKPSVSVKVEMAGDAKELDRFKFQFDADDSTVNVVGKKKKGWLFSWHWQSSDIRIRALVPKKFRAEVNTGGGDIDVSNLAGSLSCETSGGDIRAYSITGNVYGETSGGDVVLRKINGNVRAHTSGGDIEVDSVVGDIRVGTSGGDVAILNVDGKISGETSGGSIEARLIGENRGVQLETSGGNVSLYVPKSITGTLHATTSGGSVHCDFPITVDGKMSPQELRGQINGGGSIIRLSTSGGNINVRNYD